MRKLDGDLSRAVRMPLLPGAPHYGATWIGPATLAVWGIIALIAAAAVSLGGHMIAPVTLSAPHPLILLQGLLLAGAIAALVIALQRLRILQQFGRLPLEVSPQPILLGHPFALAVKLKLPPPPGSKLLARLSCMKLDFRPYGRSFRVYGESLWSVEQFLETIFHRDYWILQGRLQLPANQPPSNLPDFIVQAFLDRTPACYGWLLEIIDTSNRLPVRGFYRLDILPEEQSAKVG